MRVLKFGGTSLANPERFSQAAQLIEKAHLEEQAAGVLSAPAKITNHLIALSEKAALNQPTDTHFNEAIEIARTSGIPLNKLLNLLTLLYEED